MTQQLGAWSDPLIKSVWTSVQTEIEHLYLGMKITIDPKLCILGVLGDSFLSSSDQSMKLLNIMLHPPTSDIWYKKRLLIIR